MPLTVIKGHRKVSNRFFPYSNISTNVILSLDAQSTLSTSEVDFAFVVWQSFPERMVGFLSGSHFWDEAQGGWGYRTGMTNEFSMVLTTCQSSPSPSASSKLTLDLLKVTQGKKKITPSKKNASAHCISRRVPGSSQGNLSVATSMIINVT